MDTTNKYKFSAAILLISLLWALPHTVTAQEKDSTKVKLDLDKDSARTYPLDRRFDRSLSGGMMTEMGMYKVPSETQYYQAPFKGQDYLDMAVKAYREQLKEGIGNNWYWNFLKAVSPYISLELGAFQTMQMEYVDRTNPLFQSYKDPDKKQ